MRTAGHMWFVGWDAGHMAHCNLRMPPHMRRSATCSLCPCCAVEGRQPVALEGKRPVQVLGRRCEESLLCPANPPQARARPVGE